MTSRAKKPPLTKEAIVARAVTVADKDGLDALSMRKLAADLNTGAMSLYNHIEDKDALLVEMIDVVYNEIERPAIATPAITEKQWAAWRTAMRITAISTRDAFLRHPWAVGPMMRVLPGPIRLDYMDAILAAFANSGLAPDDAHDAYHVYDTHIAGVAMSQIALPLDSHDEVTAAATEFLEGLDAERYPHVRAHVIEHLEERDGSFGFSLDLLLDGFERLRR